MPVAHSQQWEEISSTRAATVARQTSVAKKRNLWLVKMQKRRHLAFFVGCGSQKKWLWFSETHH